MKKSLVIASIIKEEQIEMVMKSQVTRVNLMVGDIARLKEMIQKLHAMDKQVFVHVEMVQGIGRDHSTVQYLAQEFLADGIVTTKSKLIAAAKNAGIASIQRIFAIDTAAVETAIRMIHQIKPDEVELMPGLMPRVIREVKARIPTPLIVGGLIRSDEEIRQALAHGADYVSISDSSFW